MRGAGASRLINRGQTAEWVSRRAPLANHPRMRRKEEEVKTGGVEGGRGDLARDKVESKMVSETNPEGVRRYLDTCTLRGRERAGGGEGTGRGSGKEDREEEPEAEGRTAETGGTETEDVEGGALDSKEEGWGADSVGSEAESGAGWKTTGEKNDLMIVWLEEVAGCFFFLCCFNLGRRGEV